MIILVFLAVVISGGNIPVFITILGLYDLLIIAFIKKDKILNLFRIKKENMEG